MAYRVEVSDDGSTKSSDPMEARQAERAPVAAPQEHKYGGQPLRFSYDTETGDIREESAAPVRHEPKPSTGTGPLDGGRSPEGRPLASGELNESSILKHPIFGGEVRVKEALSLGWMRKTADGYVLAGEMAGKEGMAAPSDDKPEATKKQDSEPAIDAVGVPGTSRESDNFIGAIRSTAGDTVLSGALVGIAKGKSIEGQIAEISRTTQLEPAEVRARMESTLADYRRAGEAIAAKAGVPASQYESFVAWAQEARPDEAADALLGLVQNHDVTAFTRLARQYKRSGQTETAYSDAEILSARFGNGITARQGNSGVILDIPGHGSFSFAQAVRLGLLKVQRG